MAQRRSRGTAAPAARAHLSCQVPSQQDCSLLPVCLLIPQLSNIPGFEAPSWRGTRLRSLAEPHTRLESLGEKLAVLFWRLPGST